MTISNKEKTFETDSLKIDNIKIKLEKKENEKHILSLQFGGKVYYIYINYEDKDYPVALPEYQRAYKGQSKDLDDFVEDTKNNIEMYPPIRINFREIEGTTYICIIDGQQRITTACYIKGNIKKPKKYDKYKKWKSYDRENFDNFRMPCIYTNNLTLDQERQLFQTTNSRNKSLTKSELRKSMLNDKEKSRFIGLSGYCGSIYEEDKQKSKELDHVYRILLLNIYAKHKDVAKEIGINAMNDDNIRRVIKYVLDLNDTEYKKLKKEVKTVCNIINDIMGVSLKQENSPFKTSTGRSKLVNTDVLVLGILLYTEEDEEYMDFFEMYDEEIQEEINTYFLDKTFSGSSNLTNLSKIANDVKNIISKIKND